jgi:hypothetical protein
MRYYLITISNADGSVFRTYNSFPGGKNDPGALDIEIDVAVTAYDAPINNPYVRIFGVSLQDIGQASDLNGKFITMSAGMQKGLPLANPTQAGQIFSGSIFFAFGNWQGTNQSLDLILIAIQPSTVSPTPSSNIVFNWPPNTPLAQALATTFSGAFPGMKQDINVSPNLVLPTAEFGFYANLGQFATYIRSLSQHILGKTPNYPGVAISVVNGVITAYDATPLAAAVGPKQIAFTDLIGQPTWLGPVEISACLVMRGDLKVGRFLKLPTGLTSLATTTTAASLPQYRQASVFQGSFFINSLRHVGRFRQPDGASWVTVANLFVQTQS